ncbi:dTDP-glucose 4,6-dehydratase [Alteribacillus persepolensis]|uniref:dTDP-glucose 4,6-dehydratase n=1 Tax=Alteribacillus persepolensis TaxID=568899 RepID=A0A1G8JZA0_9BACI|nr:dTDP-glucose 4,6-dehydratase [Alteribacillus persepolensis]SDI36504.1 dTDP-glucose 4,6-dehydratase [Alteribacillus persepolensis]
MDNTKTILVTGGAGFIGAHFVSYFAHKYPDTTVLNLDKLTYAADAEEVKRLNNLPNHLFVEGDICDRKLIEELFEKYNIQGVIHFAAESHVDRSITGPEAFIETNIRGTFILLDTAKNAWMTADGEVRPGYENARFHHISTDEVYGSLEGSGAFTEQSPYAPNSPYSASKASADMLVRSYYRTYGLNVVTTQCSNNYGPKQHREKLIPTIIRKALQHEPIPIYGDGQNVRDWLYVLDHCKGIDLVFHSGQTGETYNIGGKNERTNLYIAQKICRVLDELIPEKKAETIKSYEELITFVKDRPGHDRRYAVDAGKIENELGWRAEEDFESGILKTVEWYVHHETF